MRLRIASLAVAAVLTIGAAACSSDDSSATTTTTTTTTTQPGPVTSASPELCAARDELRSSLAALTNVSVVTNGTAGLTAALGDVRDDLAAVRAATGDDLRSQIDAFQDSLGALQTAIEGVASGGTQVTAVVAAITTVGTSGGTLLASLGNLSCS